MSQRMKGLLAISVPVIAWGISFVSTEVLIGVLGPVTICFVRFLLAVLLMLPILIVTKQDFKIQKEDRGLFLVGGLVGIGLYFIFENIGIKYISASPAALIIAVIPVATLCAECLVNHRKMTPVDMMTGVLSLIGVVLIIDTPLSAMFSGSGLGYLLMFGAVITWVIYSLVTDRLFERYSYLVINFYQMLISLIIFLPFVFIESSHWEMMTTSMTLHLLFLAFISSVLGFVFYSVAMDLIGISEASLYINFLPIVTIIASYLFLGQTISSRQFLGGALVLLAVTVSTLQGMKKEKNKSAAYQED